MSPSNSDGILLPLLLISSGSVHAVEKKGDSVSTSLLLPVVSGKNDISFVVSRNDDAERKGDDGSDEKRVSGFSVTKGPPSPLTQHPMRGSPGQEFLEHKKERGDVSELGFVGLIFAVGGGGFHVHERCDEIILIRGRLAVFDIAAIVHALEVGATHLNIHRNYEAAFQRSVFCINQLKG